MLATGLVVSLQNAKPLVIIPNLDSSNQSEIVMIKLYCCVPTTLLRVFKSLFQALLQRFCKTLYLL